MSGLPVQDYSFVFPAIRGVQAKREYYVAMCPLRLVCKLLKIDHDELPPELRAQRVLNKARVPLISRYVLENPTSYVFSSLTASIDGQVSFSPASNEGVGRKLGTLSIGMDARILINDGQHRRAAIEESLKENPSLGNESISVVFFVDAGLERSQQMFADLNRYAIRPTKSIGILYDHRDPLARVVNRLINSVTVFKGMTEMARSTISNRSFKLFTLSSIYQATRKLLGVSNGEAISADAEELGQDFWTEIAKHMPDWQQAAVRKVSPSELRRDFVHAHGIALQAIATAGASLLEAEPAKWRARLSKLEAIDWSRNNTSLWEGRALVMGRVSKAQTNIVLTSNVIKKMLSLRLTDEEQRLESMYEHGRSR